MRSIYAISLISSLCFLLPVANGQGGDTLQTATVISGPGPHAFDLATATVSGDSGTPNFAADLFFEWAAPSTGWFRITTCGTSTGSPSICHVGPNANPMGTPLYFSARTCDVERASSAFFASQGDVRFFAICQSSALAPAGTFLVEAFQPAPNSDCGFAEPWTGPGPYAFDQTDAAPFVPTYPGPSYPGFSTVWHQWTAPKTAIYDYVGSYDSIASSPRIRVFDACNAEVLSPSPPGLRNSTPFLALEGHTYLIEVGTGPSKWGGEPGTVTLFALDEEYIGPQVFHPSTDNAYAYVDYPTTWLQAKGIAESTYLRGVPGHLVTYTDAAEELFVEQNVIAPNPLPHYVWIGYWQDSSDPLYSEPAGGWKWVTGEPANYNNWGAGKPNGSVAEAYTMDAGTWDDERNFILGFSFSPMDFVIEWELDYRAEGFCQPALANSTGVPTQLLTEVAQGSGAGVRLLIESGPPSQFGYFLVGDGFVEPGMPIGGGEFCLATQSANIFGRYNFQGSSRNSIGQIRANGTLENLVGTSATGDGFDLPLELPIPGSPVIIAGSTWHFQFWHREDGASSNFSNGMSVTF